MGVAVRAATRRLSLSWISSQLIVNPTRTTLDGSPEVVKMIDDNSKVNWLLDQMQQHLPIPGYAGNSSSGCSTVKI